MKIWLNEQYAIEKTDGNNLFGKGNDNFDYIEVYVPLAVYENDDVIPVFIFERADKKKYGEFAHNVGTWEQDGYKVFKHILNGFVLAQKGNLDITIKLNFLKYVDEKRFIEKTKNLYVQGVVLNAIVVESEAFILSDEPEAFLTSLKYLLNDLNARIESGDITAERALADGNGNNIVETYATKAESEQVLVDAKAYGDAVFETKGNVLSKVNTLKTEIQNGTVVANNANEAVSYRDNENNLVVIKDKIEDILYLINDVTGADLTGLQSKINALEVAWNNFMNGSESDDVIDTLNEIRNELASLDSATKKALYNLGAYDTVSGNVITRQTNKLILNGSENWEYIGANENGVYTFRLAKDNLNAGGSWDEIIGKTNQNHTVRARSQEYVVNNEIGMRGSVISFGGNNYASLSDFKSALASNPIEIQYLSASSYTENVIENQPLITLDSQGSKWLTEEYKKGINKLNPALFNNRTEWNTSGNSTTVFFIKLYYTDTFAWDDAVCQFELGTSDAYGRHNYTFTTDGRNNGKLYGVIGINGNVADDKNVFEINLSAGTYVYSAFLENASLDRYNIKEFMISDGYYPYEPYNANKHITNFEANFLKEESLKSANKFNGFSATNIDYYYQELPPNTDYTFSISVKDSSYSTNVSFGITDNVDYPQDFVWLINGGNLIHKDLTFNSSRFKYLFAYPSSNANTPSELKSKFNIMLVEGTEVQPYHEFEGSIVRTKELEEQVEMWQSIADSLQESYNALAQRVGKLEGSVEFTGEQFVSGRAGTLADTTGYYPAGTNSFTIDGNVKSVSITYSDRNDVSFSGSTITYTLRGEIAGRATSATITYKYTASTSTASEE